VQDTSGSVIILIAECGLPFSVCHRYWNEIVRTPEVSGEFVVSQMSSLTIGNKLIILFDAGCAIHQRVMVLNLA
jgi:hypothetical protein